MIGGPPCQGFSVAGKMDPDDPRSEHVDRFLDLVEHVDPTAFVMENVKALATSARWGAVREPSRSAPGRGGSIPDLASAPDAADFGVAQRRERMFLIGLRDACHRTGSAQRPACTDRSRGASSALPAYGETGNDTFCTAGITPAKRPVLRPSAVPGQSAVQRQWPTSASRQHGANASCVDGR